MNPAFRRNACPTLTAPMQTGDGLLARLPPLIRAMKPAALAGLARSARRFGNGTIEITARGNIQLRGLEAGSAAGLTDALAMFGLAGTTGVPITVNPFADIEMNRTGDNRFDGLADEIDSRLVSAGLAERLAPKTSIVLDFGTFVPLDALTADLRIRLDGECAHLGLGGTAAEADWIGAVAIEALPEAVQRILDVVASHGRERRVAVILRDSGAERFAVALGDLAKPALPPPPRMAFASIGLLRKEPDFAVVGFGLPFGQAAANTLIELAEAAEAADIVDIAPAPGRSILFAGTPERLDRLRERAEHLGLLVRADDPRRYVSACIGTAGCISGKIAARALAAELVTAAPDFFDGSMSVHISGCAKGCAHPETASLTLVGDDLGCSLVLDGRAGDIPRGFVPAGALSSGAARLAQDVERMRRPGETVAAILERMGDGAIVTRLQGQGEMSAGADYLRDGHTIYERSFAIIRAEADLSRFSSAEAQIAVRMIHACGLVPLVEFIRFGHDFAEIAKQALTAGATILCDAEMVERGVTRARLPSGNNVVCTLRDPDVPALAARLKTTRSAAAVDLWGERLAGALVVIGNAPTALFHLLDRLDAGALPRPAAIIGVPVGFIGAAESKAALAAHRLAIPYLVVEGRLGGSAIAAAAVNALASDAI